MRSAVNILSNRNMKNNRESNDLQHDSLINACNNDSDVKDVDIIVNRSDSSCLNKSLLINWF